jgi:predicted nucleic acid-binding protein
MEENEPRVFLDTSVLFAAVLSATGGSRLILRLAEAGVVRLWVGEWVLQEADGVLARKAPESKALFALLLDRAGVKVGPAPDASARKQAGMVVDYEPDARVLAEALAAGVDYFVTLDCQHLLDTLGGTDLPFSVGTPGDFLAWLRERMTDI